MVEHYLAMKRNEELIHAKTWMNLEIILIYGRSQPQQIIYYRVSLI